MGNDLGKIGLIGGGFQHAYSTTLWKKPKYFEWSKNNVEDITFYIDDKIIVGLNSNCNRKFAWLVESKDIVPNAVSFIKENYQKISKNYEILFTHQREIYELADNFVYIPSHGYWIEEPQIYTKTKLVSMISSNKSMSIGHKKRLSYVNKFKNHVDLYGRGFLNMNIKDEGLCDYMFSITIENDSYETYWTEKILDCFVTGTIPIYYGSPDIGNYFNLEGIITLNNNFDIKTINKELYLSKLPAIKDNFDRALKYDVIEDIIFEKWIKSL